MHNRMKEALVILGRQDKSVVRPPLVKLSEAEIARIAQAMRAAGIERDGAVGLGASGLHPASVAAE
jgi:4-hydroxy-tetrahydrodipicolinate synthase